MRNLVLGLAAFMTALLFSPESAVRLKLDVDTAEAGFGHRGGGGRGGARRGGGGMKAHHTRPRGGAKTRHRPNRAATRPSTRPSTRPATRPKTRPATRPNRPNTGNRPNRPGTGNRPNRPGAGNRPNRPGTGNRPNRPVNRPNRPNRPGYRPPGYRPPHYRPPHWRPPAWRPPAYRPPYYRAPHARWGRYWYTPYWGWYWTAAVAGATIAFVATLPSDDCEKVIYEGETLYECKGVLYRSTLQQNERVYEIVSSDEESKAAAATAGGGASSGGGATTPEEGDPLLLTSPAMRGNQVRGVQMALQSLGYDVGGVDGVFGNGTDRAVRQFQADQGLPVTGVVAGETRTRLGL